MTNPQAKTATDLTPSIIRGPALGGVLAFLLAGAPLAGRAAPCSYSVTAPPGYSMIANQCDSLAVGGNTLNNVLPGVPNGSQINKWDNTTQAWVPTSTFNGTSWSLNLTLNPGEGAFFYNPGASITLSFSGNLPTPVLPLNLPANGYCIVSCQTPQQPCTFDDIVGQPPQAGDRVYRFVSGQGYVCYIFDDFALAWTPTAPMANVGESVWICRGSAGSVPSPCNPDITLPVIDCACLEMLAHNLLFTNNCPAYVPDLCQFTNCFSDNCCLPTNACVQTPAAGTPVGPGTHPITIKITDCAGNMTNCVMNFVVTGECPCLAVTNEVVTCASNVPGKINYTFDLVNDTGVPIKYLFLVPKNNCFKFMPDLFTFPVPVPPGQTIPLTTMILLTANCPADLCFFIAAHSSNLVQCCSLMHCVRDPGCCVTNQVINLFSGHNAAGPLAGGTLDPQFSTGIPLFSTANPYVKLGIPSVWLPNGPSSKWVGPLAAFIPGSPIGVFSYTNRFFLCSTNQAAINGRWTMDDAASIWLNGAPTGVSVPGIPVTGAFALWHPVSITSPFVNGWNELVFYVTNGVEISDTGLRTELTGTACCPDCLTIDCPTNQMASYCYGSVPVSFPLPTAMSTCGTTPTVACVPPSGSLFPPGVTTVLCTATDGQGHYAGCSFTVTVQYAGSPPCFPPPIIGIVRDGTNIVLSWPAEATNFELEATDSLSPPIVWLPESAPVQEVNGRRVVTLPISGPRRFFRLRVPSEP